MESRSCMHASFPFAAVTGCLFAIAVSCMHGLDGGSGTEIGNPTVTGRVVDTNGNGAPNTLINLYPCDYDPIAGLEVKSDTTDMHGSYSFSNVRGGTYNLKAVHLESRMRTIVCGIPVGPDSAVTTSAVLRKPGTIIVTIPDTLGDRQGFVFIPGTDIRVWRSGTAQLVALDSVPAGLLPPVRFADADSRVGAPLTSDSIKVYPADTVRTAFFAWKFSKRLYLNTTAAGANVAGTVTDFPLLVRLNAVNFRFDQAKTDGSDIRFAKPDDKILPHEIAAWDQTGQRAELWVRLDTVYGNSADHSIIMYWGASTATASLSNGVAVFDSSKGFAGVWHLNETSGTNAVDASQNGFTGTYRGALPNAENSATGTGQRIARPDNDFVDVGNVLNPRQRDMALGVWVKRASFGTQQALVAKTNGDAPSSTYGFLFSIDLFNNPHFHIASGGVDFGDDGVFDVASNLTITDSTQWHHLFVSINRSENDRCRIYIDGVDRTGTIRGDISRVADVVNALSLRIGTENDNNYSFKGAIDEVTIAFAERSADWVKLCYKNQKEQDALVMW